MSILGVIIAMLIAALFSGFVIWVVARLGLGIQVTGFGAAYIAAIIIAVVSELSWL